MASSRVMIHALALAVLSSPPSIALTFDDGPSAKTPAILRALRDHGASGTFFVLGWRMGDRGGKERLRQIARAGHRIANHLWSHRRPCQMTEAQLLAELDRTQRRLPVALCGPDRACTLWKAVRRWYRPPHGDKCHRRAVRARGYAVWWWDASDYRVGKVRMWRNLRRRMAWRVRTGRKLRVVALFHGSPGKLRYILEQSKLAGWAFVL